MSSIFSSFFQLGGAKSFSEFLTDDELNRTIDPSKEPNAFKAQIYARAAAKKRQSKKRSLKKTAAQRKSIRKRAPGPQGRRKTARRTARRTASRTPKRTARKTARRTVRKTARKTARRTARRSVRRTARRSVRRTATLKRALEGRRTAGRSTPKRTARRSTPLKGRTARRSTPLKGRTSRRTQNRLVKVRQLTKRTHEGKPGKYQCVSGCKGEKAYYTGKEPSPKGLGYCARCTPLKVTMKGTDGNLWENKKYSKGKRWVRV
jgi:hypothetical protein